jgi:uncharacterized OB-fold protein
MSTEADPTEPVKSIRTPIRLDYAYTPGSAQSRFLKGLQEGVVKGQRCPKCTLVYMPPRGACPTCGRATEEEVTIADTGTVVTFCIVNVPSSNIKLELPYACANVVLDNSDTHFISLIQGVPADQVHMGMRVRTVWVDDDDRQPSMVNIKWCEPSGEPDADYESYKHHL